MPPPADTRLPASTGSRLQAVLDGSLADGGRVGVTAAVVTADGTWAGAAGRDGAGERLRPNSAMSAGSVTKTFVAAEVVRLAGEGLVDLDDPVEDHLTLPFDGRGATVREVLGMRSGYPFDPSSAFSESLTEADLDKGFTMADVLALVDPESRMGQRGGPTEYNNLNYLVLALLVEEVTGESLSKEIRDDLLDPADLQRVWLQDDEQPKPPLARGVPSNLGSPVAKRGPYLPSRALTSALEGAGGIAADSPTLAQWGYLLYGGHVIDPALVEEMIAAEDEQDWYGLGTGLVETGDHTVVGHSGDMEAYHCTMMVWIDDYVAVAVQVPQPSGSVLVSPEETATRLRDIAVDPDG